MFPSSGYFKSIPCPYFNSNGCERPYCHFKHQKASSSHKHHQIPSYSTLNSRETSCSSDSPSAKQGYAEAYRTKPKPRSGHRTAAIPRPHYQHEPFPTGPSTLVYKPTPISELNKGKTQSSMDLPVASDAVLSAQFQVIGQDSSGSATASSSLLGDGDGPSVKDSNESCLDMDSTPSLEISESIEDGGQEMEDIEPTEDVDKSSELSDAANKSLTITIDTKRRLSKKEHREFMSMFGEASDDEIDPQMEGDDDEDVVELPTVTKVPEQVIDLTACSSDEDADWEVVSEDTPAIKSEPNKSKSKKKSSSLSAEEKGQNAEQVTPITVSSSSNTGQCKELFEMFQPGSAVEDEYTNTSHAQVLEDTTEPVASKKRKARDGAKESSLNTQSKKMKVPTPQEVMNKRFEAMKQATLNQQKKKESERNGISGSSKTIDYNSEVDVTSARTYKGKERKCHEPKSKKAKKSLERPRISPTSKAKVAVTVRQAKLDMIINECLRLYPEEADAYERAKNEEEGAASRAGNRIIYTNLVANVIKKIRNETGEHMTGKTQPTVSHETVLAGKSSSKFTVGLKRKGSIHLTKDDMHGDLLFKKLRSYVLTETQLVEQGYPRPDPGKPGHALIHWTHFDKIPQMKGNMRICKRCGKGFSLTEDNGYVSKEECIFHWGKSFHTRVHGTVDMHFSCCQGKPGAEGCTICNGHVHDSNKFNDLTGFMKTFAKNNKDYCGVYALDCEMVYTTKGMEIARVTVINDKLGIMLDSFIKPQCEVIDYNTRFSGLTEENFKNVDASLKDIQAILLDMFQEDTVLIGHSLNSDLIALKLIHENVVDTSMVWPHKHGLPYKRALKNLMLEILNKLIQESGSAGHDSSEDASACMELMKWKVHQDYMKDNR